MERAYRFRGELGRGGMGAVLGHVLSGHECWNQVRALNVMLRVCEAVAFAHSKEVIHRDLKPVNVMVGRFGEVVVMGWGLARVLGREDRHDLRLPLASSPGPSLVRTERCAKSLEAQKHWAQARTAIRTHSKHAGLELGPQLLLLPLGPDPDSEL